MSEESEPVIISEGPEEYRLFMAEIGSGELDGFWFYQGFVNFEDIFDPETSKDIDPLFHMFGDDMGGAHFGFYGDTEKVVMIESSSPSEIIPIAETFEAFLKDWFLTDVE